MISYPALESERLRKIFNHFGIFTQLMKLAEETFEFIEAALNGDKDRMEEEAADLLNVLMGIVKCGQLSRDRIYLNMHKGQRRTCQRIDDNYYTEREGENTVDLNIAARVLKDLAKCPNCESEKVGNGEGMIAIDKNNITRYCKCGHTVQVNTESTEAIEVIAFDVEDGSVAITVVGQTIELLANDIEKDNIWVLGHRVLREPKVAELNYVKRTIIVDCLNDFEYEDRQNAVRTS